MTTTVQRHGLEASLFTATAVLAAVSWLLVLFGGGGILAVAMLVGGAWVGTELLIARAQSGSIRVGPDQLADLWSRYARVGARLGLSRLPPLYVQQSGGAVNAYAARIASRTQVVLFSGLLDALEHDPEALDFIIAHELGHHLARHTATARSLFIGPLGLLGLLPFQLGLSRSQEFTADRYGLHGSSLAAAHRALIVLSGGRIAARASAEAILAQWPPDGPWGHVAELASTHPALPRRLAQLGEYARRLEPSAAAVPLSTTLVRAG